MKEKKQIKFEDIRSGDLIEVVDICASGLKIKKEGIAADLVESPARSVWHHKGTQRQQMLVEYGSRGEIWLLDRVEPRDWVVLVLRQGGNVDTAVGYEHPVTEAAAKAAAKRFSGLYTELKYWAVQIPA